MEPDGAKIDYRRPKIFLSMYVHANKSDTSHDPGWELDDDVSTTNKFSMEEEYKP